MGKTPIMEITADVKLLAQRLEQAAPGELVSYNELNSILGQDVQKRYRYKLQSACGLVFRESKKVFGAVSGEGLQYLTGEQVSMRQDARVKSIGKKAKRGLRELSVVNMAELSDSEKSRVYTIRTILSLTVEGTAAKTVKKIEAAVGNSKCEIATAKLLEFFK
jgi:hypothetical protein